MENYIQNNEIKDSAKYDAERKKTMQQLYKNALDYQVFLI